jgi:hypothetical protein
VRVARATHRPARTRSGAKFTFCSITSRGRNASKTAYRHDSVVAGADFIHALDELWREWDAAGKDMAFTGDKFCTDPQQHASIKIADRAANVLQLHS